MALDGCRDSGGVLVMATDASREDLPQGRDVLALGQWLRQERVAQNLTQRVLAERAGVSRSYLGDIERGRGARPSVTTIDRLATAIGATRLDLFRAAGMLGPAGGEDGQRLAERRILAMIRELSPAGRASVERFARFAYHEEQAWSQAALLVELDDTPRSTTSPGDLPLFHDLPSKGDSDMMSETR